MSVNSIILKGIKHVFFDLDHTLWDFDRNSALCFQQIFNENNITLDLDIFLAKYKPINASYWKLYREEKVSKLALRYGRFKDTFEALSFKTSNNEINVLSDAYIKNLTNHNYLLDGAVSLLDYLQEKYQLHIITNGFEEVQKLKLVKSNIDRYFKTVTSSEKVGVKKPNPKVFQYALEISGAKKEESVMIGDNYEADIQGAIEFGLKAIYLEDSNSIFLNNKVLKVNSLNQLKQYL